MLDIVDQVIIQPGLTTYINEPHYNESDKVDTGIQDGSKGSFGRSILDAAFDVNYVYIIPVVVDHQRENAYPATAKLKLLDGQKHS